MGIAFAAEVVREDDGVVEAVFSREVVLRNETKAEAAVPSGQIALIANYRGFNTSGKGKKARGAGEAVLDLSAVARITAKELPVLISRLEELQKHMTTGVKKANDLEKVEKTEKASKT